MSEAALDASGAVERLRAVRGEVARVVVGQERLVDRLLLALVTGGHLLVEGVPGLAKTLACEAIAGALDLRFHRIQFTPDLLPADLVGTPIFHPGRGVFEVKRGPIFAHLVLADEINRAPAKVHSALLEAMQERQVSIGDETFPLEEPFVVLATQNPIEQEGTYALPEAEIDRFLLKVVVDYPSAEEEAEIVRSRARTEPPPLPQRVAGRADVLAARRLVDRVHVEDRLVRYVLALVRATRRPAEVGLARHEENVRLGASPRASIALVLAARARALLRGRDFATPDDVKDVAHEVLRHRILLTYDAEAEGVTTDRIVDDLLAAVEVP